VNTRISDKPGFALLLALTLLIQGCGYQLQNSSNPLKEKYGVRKVFVNSLVNSSYKAGVENLVYNALILELRSQKKLILVNSIHDADAVINGDVASATSTGSGGVPLNTLKGAEFSRTTLPDKVGVASTYKAEISATFSLVKLVADPTTGKKSPSKTLWTGAFSRQKEFPASTQAGVLGTTSALINESSFERALDDLSTSMMAELHESMLSVF
jgi:hypothetical protein